MEDYVFLFLDTDFCVFRKSKKKTGRALAREARHRWRWHLREREKRERERGGREQYGR
jgi:hypothetical protein